MYRDNQGLFEKIGQRKTRIFLWPYRLIFNCTIKKINQIIHHALSGKNGGDHQLIHIAAREVNVVASPANEEGKEQALGSTISLPEWVKHIQIVVKL